jgi:hypothetical protein
MRSAIVLATCSICASPALGAKTLDVSFYLDDALVLRTEYQDYRYLAQTGPRQAVLRMLSRRPISSSEDDCAVAPDARNPRFAVLRGRVKILVRRGDDVIASAAMENLKLVRMSTRYSRWYVARSETARLSKAPAVGVDRLPTGKAAVDTESPDTPDESGKGDAEGITVEMKATWGRVQGDPRGLYSRDVDVTLDLTGGLARGVTHCGMLSLKKAVVDGIRMSLRRPRGKDLSGTSVILGSNPPTMVRVNRGNTYYLHPSNGTRVKFSMSGEVRPGRGKSVLHASGTITLRTGSDVKHVDVPCKGLSAQKPVNHPALVRAGINLKVMKALKGDEPVDRTRSIGFIVEKGSEAIHSLTLVDSKGVDLGDDMVIYDALSKYPQREFVVTAVHFKGKLPADACVRITIVGGLREMVLPFEAVDVPIVRRRPSRKK